MPRRHIAKGPADVRSIARSYTVLAMNTLAGIAASRKAPAAARVTACGHLLDRGWGRSSSDAGDTTNIRIVIRQLISGDGAAMPLAEPGKVIEHQDVEQPLNYGVDELD